jgi:hypothetical protein
MRVLNVGGNRVGMPRQYDNWERVLLDIDPTCEPDILMDARQLKWRGDLEGQFDAVFASHVLEHFHECEIPVVLEGFYHVLAGAGVVDVRVPDDLAVMRAVADRHLDLDSTLYQSPVGPIRVCDVMWGYQKQIASSGQPFFAHRFGFSERTLTLALERAGFWHMMMDSRRYEIKVLAFKRIPESAMLERLGVYVG